MTFFLLLLCEMISITFRKMDERKLPYKYTNLELMSLVQLVERKYCQQSSCFTHLQRHRSPALGSHSSNKKNENKKIFFCNIYNIFCVYLIYFIYKNQCFKNRTRPVRPFIDGFFGSVPDSCLNRLSA